MTTNGLERVIVLTAVLLISGIGVTRSAAEDNKSRPEENGPEIEKVKAKKLISLSLVGADLRAVITALAQKHGLNIYGGEKIKGTVTAHLKDVPLEDLLKVLLKSNGYVMVKHSDVFYEVVAQSEEARKKEHGTMARRRGLEPASRRFAPPRGSGPRALTSFAVTPTSRGKYFPRTPLRSGDVGAPERT